MKPSELADKYIRLVEENVKPEDRHPDWDKQGEWVRATLERLARELIENTTKEIVEIIEDVDIHTRAEILEAIRALAGEPPTDVGENIEWPKPKRNKCIMLDCSGLVASDEPFERYCADHKP